MIQKVPNEIFKETKQKKNSPAAKAVCVCVFILDGIFFQIYF